MVIGVIGAMDAEVQNIVKEMTDIEEIKLGHLCFKKGIINSHTVVVVKSGIGKVNAGICTEMMIMYFKVSIIINTGIAGALSASLHTFDTVISEEVVFHDIDVTAFGYKLGQVPGIPILAFPADSKLIDFSRDIIKEYLDTKRIQRNVLCGRIASGDIFVNNKDIKEKISNNFNALCVEMEGAAIAQVCYLNSIPFIIIRTISDAAEKIDEVYFEKECAEASTVYIVEMIKRIK